ncbi:hypothetical protein BDZ97DRAFT_1790287 [Flammula alnicola]|nr:hypothetical protein BDZ97DRAFT_1790287 [Flammula alnicola]
MSSFDLNAYYAEQEERMNIPDETIDEFMKRASSFRRSEGYIAYESSRMPRAKSAIQRDEAQSSGAVLEAASPPALAAPSCVPVQPSKITSNDSPVDSGRNMKRKASDLRLEAAGKRKKESNQDSGMEISVDLPEIEPSNSLGHDKDLPLPESISDPDEIDSFTVDLGDPPVPVERKTASRVPRESPRKKRLLGNRSPQASPVASTADYSPILSFSRILEPSPKKRSISRKEDSIPVARKPQLEFRPLQEVPLERQASRNKIGHAPTTSEDLASSIEELNPPAASRADAKKSLAEKPNEMYLEVKERIAKHSTKKHRDKVVKLTSKPVLQESSISKVAARPIDESDIIYISSSPSSRASSPGLRELGVSKKEQKLREKQKKPTAEKRKQTRKKEKPQPMTPAEYARMLQAKPTDEMPNLPESSTSRSTVHKKKTSSFKFLEGKNIFYAGGDMRNASATTRGRMDLIVKYGGNLVPEFDANVTTHIITDAQVRPTLRALGLEHLNQIPDHIPTVRWTWLLTVMGRESALSQDEIEAKLGDVWMHAAFGERMDAGYKPQIIKSAAYFKGKGKEKAPDEPHNDESESRPVSEFEPALWTNRPTSTVRSALSSISDIGIGEPARSSRPANAPPSPPTSPLAPIGPSRGRSSRATSASNVTGNNEKEEVEDPLAEFYQLAKMHKEDGWSSLGELDVEDSDETETDDDDGIPPSVQAVPRQKRGWTCDKKEPQRTTDCPNQDIIDKLTELMELHKAKLGDGDHWRAFSYSKCIRALRNHSRRIKSYEEARGIRGVGERTARKIEEILQTGDLQRIKYEKTKDVEVTQLFQGIYGVGQSIAFQWYSAGCRTLDDVKAGKGGVKLTPVQEIGLRFYDDINDRMPRAEAKAIFDLIKPIALSIDPKLFIEIMGSYRRGKADCGDIDILITRPTDDGNTHSGVLPRLLQELHAASILTEDLAHPDDPHDLEATYRGLCRLPNVNGSRRRRIDFLSVPWACRGAALLYYTGDDIFNRAIRMKANVLGYSLNQRGLFGNVVRDPRDRRIKMNTGVLVASETEEEIFKILGVPWQEPHERVRG